MPTVARGILEARRAPTVPNTSVNGTSIGEASVVQVDRLGVGFEPDAYAARRGDDQRPQRERDQALDDHTRAGYRGAEEELQSTIRILRGPACDLCDREARHEQLRESEPDEAQERRVNVAVHKDGEVGSELRDGKERLDDRLGEQDEDGPQCREAYGPDQKAEPTLIQVAHDGNAPDGRSRHLVAGRRAV